MSLKSRLKNLINNGPFELGLALTLFVLTLILIICCGASYFWYEWLVATLILTILSFLSAYISKNFNDKSARTTGSDRIEEEWFVKGRSKVFEEWCREEIKEGISIALDAAYELYLEGLEKKKKEAASKKTYGSAIGVNGFNGVAFNKGGEAFGVNGCGVKCKKKNPKEINDL